MSDISSSRPQGESRPKWRLGRTQGLLICFGVAFLLALSRRPEQWYPYGEDGTIFYQQAHELGLRSLFVSYGGYLHLGLRIMALFLAQFPPSLMPFAMVTTALALQAGIATYIFSDEISNLVPSQFHRGLFAFVYIGLPDIDEVHGHFVNSQWHLALLSALLIFGRAPATRAGKVVRLLLVAILSLTGPFVAFLLPLTVYKLYRSRNRFNLGLVLCSIPSCLQVCSALLSNRDSHPWHDFLLPLVIPRTFGGRGFLSAAISPQLFRDHWFDPPVEWAAMFGVLVLCLYAIKEGKRFSIMLIYLGTCVILASFKSGVGSVGARLDPTFSNRYFFIFGFGLLTTMILIVASEKRYVRIATVCCVAGLLSLNWRLPHPEAFWPKYQAALQRYDQAAPGTWVVFPERPDGWVYQIRKR